MRSAMILAVALQASALLNVWAQQQVPPPPPEPPAAAADVPPPPAPYPQSYPTQPVPPPQPYPYPPAPSPGYLVSPAPVVLLPAACAAPRFWFDMEGLIWWMKNPPLPVPLLTTGPAAQGFAAGSLGAPGTQSLDPNLSYGTEVGLNLNGGIWIDAARTAGIEGSVFFLEQQTVRFGANDPSGTGQSVINEPVAGLPSTLVSAPGIASGNALVSTTSRFWGADINGIFNLVRTETWTVNLLSGFRYLGLRENLGVGNSSTLLTTATFTDVNGNVTTAPPGSSISEFDSFQTENDFYGVQLGAALEYRMGQWFIGGSEKIALGVTRETVMIDGSTNVYPVNGPPVFFQGGNFTGPTNLGCFGQTRFAAVSELKLNVGYQLTPLVRAWLGYDLLYWTSVLRPGNQIDNNFDGVTHPLVPMVTSPFWAQGIDLGVQFNF